MADEPEEDLLDRVMHAGQLHALHPHGAGCEVAHVVVVGSGQRQMQPRCATALDDLRRSLGARGPHSARFIDHHVALCLRLSRPAVLQPRAAPYTKAQGL